MLSDYLRAGREAGLVLKDIDECEPRAMSDSEVASIETMSRWPIYIILLFIKSKKA